MSENDVDEREDEEFELEEPPPKSVSQTVSVESMELEENKTMQQIGTGSANCKVALELALQTSQFQSEVYFERKEQRIRLGRLVLSSAMSELKNRRIRDLL
jgi:precorrin-6B methylase 2